MVDARLTEDDFSYLGVPITAHQPTLSDCRTLLSRLQDCLHQWEKLFLDGRRILIALILTALISYERSLFHARCYLKWKDFFANSSGIRRKARVFTQLHGQRS